MMGMLSLGQKFLLWFATFIFLFRNEDIDEKVDPKILTKGYLWEDRDVHLVKTSV